MSELNFDKYTHILVVDLEATCCDLHSIPRHQMETIEIGAVMVDQKSLSIVDEFQTFIKPRRHPIFTDFCLQLTSITQDQVDTALTFPDATDLPYPFSSNHVNLKEQFSIAQKLTRRYGMAQVLKLTGVELVGTHHRGIDDARNISQLLPYILARKTI